MFKTYQENKVPHTKARELELIALAVKGDQQAYKELYDKNKSVVFSLLFNLTKSVDTAEDLTQETFLKAFTHLNTFRCGSKLSTWLFRIATNLFYMSRRKYQAELVSMDEFEFYPDAIPSLVHCDKHGDCLLKEVLVKQVNKLAKRQREVFVYRFVNEFSLQESADALHCSIGNIRSQGFRAKAILRRNLRKYKGLVKV